MKESQTKKFINILDQLLVNYLHLNYDYSVNEEATEYFNEPKVYNIVAPLHEAALAQSTTKQIYDPTISFPYNNSTLSVDFNHTTNIQSIDEVD